MSNYATYKNLGEEYKSSDTNSQDIASNPAPNKRANSYFTYKDLDDEDTFKINQTKDIPEISDKIKSKYNKK